MRKSIWNGPRQHVTNCIDAPPSDAAPAIESGALAPVRMRISTYLTSCNFAFLVDVRCLSAKRATGGRLCRFLCSVLTAPRFHCVIMPLPARASIVHCISSINAPSTDFSASFDNSAGMFASPCAVVLSEASNICCRRTAATFIDESVDTLLQSFSATKDTDWETVLQYAAGNMGLPSYSLRPQRRSKKQGLLCESSTGARKAAQ